MRRCEVTESASGVCRVMVDGRPFGRALKPLSARGVADWLEGAIADGLLERPARLDAPAPKLRVEAYQPPTPTPDVHGAEQAAEILRQLKGGSE